MLINACFATDNCTRVLDHVFGRAPSTQPYAYEYFLSTEDLEYECSKNDILDYEYSSSESRIREPAKCLKFLKLIRNLCCSWFGEHILVIPDFI